MERRKFIIGAGSLAAGSAAAMGTGAFSFANVERNMNVAVADDASAFLALDASNSKNNAYVDASGDALDLNFDGNAGVGGSGVNANSDYLFRDVFRVTNQGTQGVGIWFNDFQDGDDPSAGTSQDAPVEWYIQRLDSNGNLTGSLITAGNNNPAPDVDVGETVAVGLTILLRDNNASDLPDKVRVYADKAGYDGGN